MFVWKLALRSFCSQIKEHEALNHFPCSILHNDCDNWCCYALEPTWNTSYMVYCSKSTIETVLMKVYQGKQFAKYPNDSLQLNYFLASVTVNDLFPQ